MRSHCPRVTYLFRAQASPWSIGDIGILDNNQLANGPGRSYKQQASSLTVIVGYGRIKSPLATGIGITANGQKQKGKQ